MAAAAEDVRELETEWRLLRDTKEGQEEMGARGTKGTEGG